MTKIGAVALAAVLSLLAYATVVSASSEPRKTFGSHDEGGDCDERFMSHDSHVNNNGSSRLTVAGDTHEPGDKYVQVILYANPPGQPSEEVARREGKGKTRDFNHHPSRDGYPAGTTYSICFYTYSEDDLRSPLPTDESNTDCEESEPVFTK